MTDVPAMDEVLKDAPKNWGKRGDQDEAGALNYLTVEAEDRQDTFLYAAAPLKVSEASGSPVNPLVIK